MNLSKAIAQAALASPEAFRAVAELILSSPEAAQSLGIETSENLFAEVRALPPQAFEAVFDQAQATKPEPEPSGEPGYVSAGVTMQHDPGDPGTAGKALGFSAWLTQPVAEPDPIEVAAWASHGPEKLAQAREVAASYRRLAESHAPELSLKAYLSALLT